MSTTILFFNPIRIETKLFDGKIVVRTKKINPDFDTNWITEVFCLDMSGKGKLMRDVAKPKEANTLEEAAENHGKCLILLECFGADINQ